MPDGGTAPVGLKGHRRVAAQPDVEGGEIGRARDGVVEAERDRRRRRADVARGVLQRDADRVLARPAERADRHQRRGR